MRTRFCKTDRNLTMESTPPMPPADDFQNLLFETSPYGNVDAIVEHDQRVVYFYLRTRGPAAGRTPTRACWVRNLTTGPLVINRRELEQGIPTLLPRTHCVHQTPQPLPFPERLRIVWFEEGNGAALLEDNQLIAVIPPWSGSDGFHGYATECGSESPVAWPLPAPAAETLGRRIEAAADFWEQFQETPSPFARRQQELLDTYRQRFAADGDYFAIDGGQFPPRGMLQLDDGQRWTLLTVGMSLVPQPNVELSVDQPAWHRRVELGFQSPTPVDDALREAIRNRLAAIAAYPWRESAWLGHGHTIAWLPNGAPGDTSHPVALLVADSFLSEKSAAKARRLPLPDFRSDPTNLLWLLPISAREQQLLQQGGTLDSLQLPPDRLPAN